MRFALCDCNNFFVSCERIFRPDLEGRPVVVLSSNDGCVISRSNEAKALGIVMGEPYFKIRGFLEAKGVTVFSGNLRLYGEVSRRVMAVLRRYTDRMEAYSIDEAFLNFSIASVADPVAYAREIRKAVLEESVIPVSIGIAPTKTLAKLAAERGKKDTGTGGVFSLEVHPDIEGFLEGIPVGDVWGIGRRCAESLARRGIGTARKFAAQDDDWIRKHYTVRGLHTAWELRGISCIRLVEEDPPQKSVQVSRSFGQPIRSLGELRKAVAAHAVTGAERLREQGLAAAVIQVYLSTSRFREGFTFHEETVRLSSPTASTPDLVAVALKVLDAIYRPGFDYAKAGIGLTDLRPDGVVQCGLFEDPAESGRRRKARALMAAVDGVNRVLGNGTLRPALLFGEQEWESKHEKRSEGIEDRFGLMLDERKDKTSKKKGN
jgi:DNA polymerase V